VAVGDNRIGKKQLSPRQSSLNNRQDRRLISDE
jgi:hypothetical protein